MHTRRLSSNQIGALPAGVFQGLRALKELWVATPSRFSCDSRAILVRHSLAILVRFMKFAVVKWFSWICRTSRDPRCVLVLQVICIFLCVYIHTYIHKYVLHTYMRVRWIHFYVNAYNIDISFLQKGQSNLDPDTFTKNCKACTNAIIWPRSLLISIQWTCYFASVDLQGEAQPNHAAISADKLGQCSEENDISQVKSVDSSTHHVSMLYGWKWMDLIQQLY